MRKEDIMNKKLSRLISTLLCLMMLLSCISFSASATTGKLSLPKTVFAPGELTIDFTDSASSKDFISIYPISTPDGTNQHTGELAYAYTYATSGTVTAANFHTNTGSATYSNPDWINTPGDYIAKYWSADQYKVVLDTKYFSISKMTLNKYEFGYGNDITFNYVNSTNVKDFISIYKGDNPDGTGASNGELDYLYTPDESGTVTFSPEKDAWMKIPGEYIAKYWHADQYKVLMGKVTFTILPESVVIPTEYYVKKGGSGDGRTVDTPAGTIVDVVTSINADGHTTGDTVTVYVIDSGEAALTKIDSDCVIGYNNNGIGQVPAHTATIRYTGYDENVRSRIGHVNYQGANSNAQHLQLSGPSIFENIDILDMRNSKNGVTDVYFNWYPVELKNSNFIDLQTDGTVVDSVPHVMLGQTRGNKIVNRGDVEVTIDDISFIRKGGYMSISGYTDSGKTQGMTGNVTLNILGGTMDWLHISESSGTESISGNLNLVMRGNTTLNKFTSTWNASYAPMIVGGAVQLVADYGTTIPETELLTYSSSAKTAYSPVYYLTSETAEVSLDITDTVGKYAVTSDKLAYAVSGDGDKAFYGEDYITVDEPARYRVYTADSVDSIKAALTAPEAPEGFEFIGWDTSVEGAITPLFSLKAEEGVTSIWLDTANGNDENLGLTRDTAVETAARAFALADASADEVRRVVVIGDFTITGNLPAHNNMITIMGDGTGKSNLVIANSFLINGPTTIADINFHYTVDNCFMNTQDQNLIIGKNVTFTNDATNYTYIRTHFGLQNANSTSPLTLEVNSGINAYIGSYYNSETRTTAGAKITVNGGNSSFIYGADGWKTDGTQFGTVYTDTVSIVLNGGSYTTTISSKYPTGFECDLQFIANNGLALPALSAFDVEEGYGVYKLEAEAEEGCALDTTEKAGTFAVIGDKTALAVSSEGKQYVSASGLLTVPAGEYTVTFEDEVYYTNDGEKLNIYKDVDLDLADIPHTEKAGKLFIGWAYEDGTSPESASLKAGDVLYANYIDFDLDKDFYIEGAQIRLKESIKKGEGLRFVIRKTDAADALDIKGYGSVIAPSLAVGKSKVELGKTYTYNNKEYAAKTVPAVNIFAQEDGYEQYTVCVTKIGKERYATVFAVRGYIEYTDLNGGEHILYTDYYATNLVNVAQALLDDETATDEAARTRCETIIETEKQRVRDKYNNLEKLQLWNNLTEASGLAGYVPLDEKYQLGAGGVSVREVVIETGDENAEPLEIFQVTDLHFNYCNDEDFEEANPSIMATYNGRKWLANGSSVPNAIRSLEYASQGDAIVITGDVLDYMSRGAIELTHKYIWDPYPNALIAFGNHEMTRRCQDNPVTPDPTSLESRYEFLQENWEHDVYYTSKVVKDKVMLIQLDNGSSRFWDSQIEPLKADLALAREKGYTVLLFYHIPLCTKNPNEAPLYPIRRNDTYEWDFSVNEIGNPSTTDAATLEVYDIITNSADVIKATFCGHFHSDYTTEIIAKTADGTDTVIPQYILTGNPYDGGHALKITVK